MSQSATSLPVIRDPFTLWLRTIQAGAVIGALGAAATAAWDYALISSRVQYFPDRRSIEMAYPFVVLGVTAFNWMSAWLMTTRWPLYDPLRERRFSAGLRRARADLLRLLLSACFVLWSLRVWGLIGPSRRMSDNYWQFNWITIGGDSAAFFLLWMHLYWLSRRVKLRGMPWRTLIVLIPVGVCRSAANLWPLTLVVRQTTTQRNMLNGVGVLTASLTMLALGRCVWSLHLKLRETKLHGPGVGIV